MSEGIKYIPLTFVTSAAEKERLIRNTVLLRHFARESNGETALSHYIEGTQYGFNASAKESGTNKFVRISDISNGEIAWQTVPFCDCDDPESYLLKRNDIVIARTGGTTGKSYIVTTPPPGSIYAGYLIRVRANSETNPLFLSVFLNSYLYWSQITSLNRDEFRPSVNAEKLKTLHLPKFDRAVQDQIVRFSNDPGDDANSSIRAEVDSVLTKRNRHESIVAQIDRQQLQLDMLKKVILQEAIQGKLTAEWRATHPDTEPASDLLKRIQAEKARLIADKKLRHERPLPKILEAETPFEIPKGWEWCRFGEVIRTYEAGRSFKCEDREVTGQEWGVIKTSAVTSGNFDEHENKFLRSESPDNTAAQVKIGNLIFCRASGSKGLAGICAIVRDCSRNLLLSDKTIRVVLMSAVSQEYVALHNDSPHSKAFFNGLSTGKSTSMNNVTRGELFRKPVPLPPLAEQTAIVERVQALMETCHALQGEIERSRTHAAHLLQAVLNEAFAPAYCGKLVTQDESDSLAAIFLEAIRVERVSSPTNPKVIPLAVRASRGTKASQHTKGIFYRRAALDCYVIEKLDGDPDLGRTKLEKISHLLEYHCCIELEREPIRDAAGPNDYPARIKVESLAKKQKWYSTRTREGGAKIDYVPGPHISKARSTATNFIGDRKAAVDALLAIMRPLDTKRAEVVATLYASWNDFLLAGKTPSDEELVHDVRTNWHPGKELIPIEWWLKTLGWMRRKQLLPTGSGKPVTHKLLSAPSQTSSGRTAQNKPTSRGKRKRRP